MKIINRKDFFIGLGAGMLITLALIFGAGYLLFYWYAGNDVSEKGKLLEPGLEAPPFPSEVRADYNWSVRTLEGQEVPMAQAKGKVVFINFWATWCPPCVAEMPGIQRLYEQMKDRAVMFVCVSQEESSKVAPFIKSKGFTFPIYTLSGEPPAVFSTRGIPATFILSPDGRIVFKHIGCAKWDDARSIAFIEGLLP